MENPRTTPSVRKLKQGERERKEKNAINNGHYFLPETTKGSALTSFVYVYQKCPGVFH